MFFCFNTYLEMETLPEEIKITILHFVGVKHLQPTPSARVFYNFMVMLGDEDNEYSNEIRIDELDWKWERDMEVVCDPDEIEYLREGRREERQEYYKEKENSMWNKWKHILPTEMMAFHLFEDQLGKYDSDSPRSPTPPPPKSPPPAPKKKKKVRRRRKKTTN